MRSVGAWKMDSARGLAFGLLGQNTGNRKGDPVADSGKVDEAFWKRADAYIHLANAQADHATPNEVNGSQMYAAARFSAFVVTSEAPSLESLKGAKAQALEYFTAQFRKMLEDNLDDHIAHYDRYFARKGKPG